MAVVAIHAVVFVAGHPLMNWICRGSSVTTRALKDRVIGRIRMASGTDAIRAAMVNREEGVIARRQRCRNPSYGRVAGVACGWPSRADVIRIGGSVERSRMARIAGSRRAGENVVDVALVAIDGSVRARERERSVVVVECRSRPCRRVVTRVAGGRKTRRCVGGIGSTIPFRLMTAVARGGQCRVVIVRMALRTRECEMSSGEREGSVVVIERRWNPRACRMAD